MRTNLLSETETASLPPRQSYPPMSTTLAAKPLRFFVWENVLCKYGAPGMACAAGYTYEHALKTLCEKLAQDGSLREPGETYEAALVGWQTYFSATPFIEMTAPGAYYVEADGG